MGILAAHSTRTSKMVCANRQFSESSQMGGNRFGPLETAVAKQYLTPMFTCAFGVALDSVVSTSWASEAFLRA